MSKSAFLALWATSRHHIDDGAALSARGAREATAAVRGLYEQCGMSRPAIARELGISVDRVKQICLRSARSP